MLNGWKTYIGAAIVLASVIAKHLGYDFDVEGVTNDAITIIGAIIVAYGRATAATPGALAKQKVGEA